MPNVKKSRIDIAGQNPPFRPFRYEILLFSKIWTRRCWEPEDKGTFESRNLNKAIIHSYLEAHSSKFSLSQLLDFSKPVFYRRRRCGRGSPHLFHFKLISHFWWKQMQKEPMFAISPAIPFGDRKICITKPHLRTDRGKGGKWISNYDHGGRGNSP